MQRKKAEEMQRQLYDGIASQYTTHSDDYWSKKYHRRFIDEPMLGNINLSSANVIDAFCGSGEMTSYLLEKGAHITGIDISQEQIANFQKHFPGCIGICSSILSTGLESNFYDCVVVAGGLHHVHPHVPEAINEIHRILKVGGYFCFVEPHKGSLADRVRRLWYQHDSMFAENEAAIDLVALKADFSPKFKFISEVYKGNIAYLLVLQSMVLRLPLQIKSIYSPLLMKIESILEKIQGKLFSCYVICQWMKI